MTTIKEFLKCLFFTVDRSIDRSIDTVDRKRCKKIIYSKYTTVHSNFVILCAAAVERTVETAFIIINYYYYYYLFISIYCNTVTLIFVSTDCTFTVYQL